MASEIATCRLRVENPSLIQGNQSSSQTGLSFKQPSLDDSRIFAPQNAPLIKLAGHDFPLEMRLKWADEITKLFLEPVESECACDVRDFDLILKPDGLVENLSDNLSKYPAEKAQLRAYPACYRIPNSIIFKINSREQKARRAELFALGCIQYELISGNELFPNLGEQQKEEEIQARYTEGQFPDDVWELSVADKILAFWCPQFPQELLESRDSLGAKFINHIHKRPIVFGFQVLGGVASLASLVALPILGAVGFTAAGPLVGSAASAWQAGIGLVEAGSLFAWCQSAAMGGAAVGGILATGVTGAGVAVSATVAGELDGGRMLPDLKERFLAVWEREFRENVEDKAKL